MERVNREEKSHADWMNWHILEQINREEKQTIQSVFSILIVCDQTTPRKNAKLY